MKVRAAIRIEGETEADGAVAGVRAEATLIPTDTDLASAVWMPMIYSGEVNGADEYVADLPIQMAGEYQAAARFSTDAGTNWTVAVYRDGSLPGIKVEATDDTTPPAAPATVSILRASVSGVVVSWEPVAEDGLYVYRIYRTDEDGATNQIGEVPAGTTLYMDKAVVEGKSYTYAVSAVDVALNESAPTAAEPVEVVKQKIAVTFTAEVPEYTDSAVYIAGSFGTSDYPTWDPAGIPMTQVDATHWSVTLDLPEGASVEYKYVRGDWAAVEKGPACEEIANRRLKVEFGEIGAEGLQVNDVVAKWRDLDACG
jgi:hypothetical protein